ncbi:MAG: hypothetical protein ACRDLL_13505 [Solirubrobacterales bacterium]
MRPVLATLLLAATAWTVAGCGGTNNATPVACREGSDAYLSALRGAPGEVRLRGETPISECLVENQKAGDLANVGTAMVAAATELNAGARAEPGGAANLRLGYLLGAAQRGAAGTNGIHAELIRRLSSAASYSPDNQPLSAAFSHAYKRGFSAGEDRG